jgi:hypothetical protein
MSKEAPTAESGGWEKLPTWKEFLIKPKNCMYNQITASFIE